MSRVSFVTFVVIYEQILRVQPCAKAGPKSAPRSPFSATSVHSLFWKKSFLAYLLPIPCACRPIFPGIPGIPLPLGYPPERYLLARSTNEGRGVQI